MTRVVWFVWLFGCVACRSAGVPLPVLSVQAVAVLRGRVADAERRWARDFAVTAQIAFAGAAQRRERPGVAPRAGPELLLPPSAALEPDACANTALCEWAWATELATLVALGVSP